MNLPKTPKLNFPRPSSKNGKQSFPFSGGKGKNGKKQSPLNSILKGVGMYALIGLAALIFFASLFNGGDTGSNVPISQVINDVQNGKIDKINVEGDKVVATFKENGKQVTARKESGQSIYQTLKDSNVDPKLANIEVKDIAWQQGWLSILGTILPIALMVGFFFLILRQAKDAGQGIFAFGQSKARLFTKDSPQIKFTDVAGADEAKRELQEVVEFLKTPEKFKALGARIPKGVLLVGPSGVGKTLLARSVAGEAGVPFYSIAGSEFMEMLVGVGASVTGDTPVLIRDEKNTRLIPIEQIVDDYYHAQESGVVKYVKNIQTLGFKRKETGFRGGKNMLVFNNSDWVDVKAVYRHIVDHIYEVEYLGGKLRMTGDHSVFIRENGRIISKRTDQLKKGDLLVELPLNIRHWDSNQKKTIHEVKAHNFDPLAPLYLDFWQDDPKLQERYNFVLSQSDTSSYKLAAQIGISQTTILNWRHGKHLPQLLSKKLVKLQLPTKVLASPDLLKAFGYFTAEGRCGGCLELVFGAHEPDVYGDFINCMRRVFNLEPVLEFTTDNSVKVKYYSHHLGRFFSRYCGTGAYNKHLPDFIWDMPKEYFLSFLEGYSKGDGYITKSGKLVMSSVSRQLMRELAWLCAMHGIKTGIKHEIIKGGRVIKNKSLPDSEVWTLIIGRTANPFLKGHLYPNQFKRAIVQKVTKKDYQGFVYDLCGVDNEAFFGGEKPVLLHNSRVRDLFAQAKKAGPSIIFIDEIESIGRQRGQGFSGGHDEREQTLNQILVEMDGFTPNDSTIVVGATNRPDLLDVALVRPGRFDRRVTLGFPDLEERKAIIELHMKGKPFTKDVSIDRIARRTIGFSGADLANMLNEAAILAARDGKSMIDEKDLEEAATKEKLGPKRKRMQSENDRKLSAYHEAGHAIVGHFLPQVDPVHGISIVSRGMSGGHTMFPPTEDRSNETKQRLTEQIASALGGQAAEEVVFKDISTGASSDIRAATSLAKDMVMQYGMSPLGPINLQPAAMFGMWKSTKEGEEMSQELHATVDREVKKILDTAYKTAIALVKKNRLKLDKVAKELLEKESLDSEEFEKLVGKKVLKAIQHF